jgi:hypothetical protein
MELVMDVFPKQMNMRPFVLSVGSLVAVGAIAAGILLRSAELNATPQTTVEPARSEPAPVVGEVDFGFVELHPGKPGAVQSYKYAKPMVVYGGEQFEFRALSDYPIPPLELRAGGHIQPLPGIAGKVTIAGPPGQPLPVTLIAQGERVSLPGGAPPRVSVKVQVVGQARLK